MLIEVGHALAGELLQSEAEVLNNTVREKLLASPAELQHLSLVQQWQHTCSHVASVGGFATEPDVFIRVICSLCEHRESDFCLQSLSAETYMREM